MSEDFHLEPLPADADTGDLLEALGPIEERPPESQYCVFRSGRERFCLPVLDVEEVLDWPLLTKLPLGPAYLIGIFNLRGGIVPLIDIAITEGRRPGLLPKHVVVASLRAETQHEDVRIGIASDEVIGTYSVNTEDLLEQPAQIDHQRQAVVMPQHSDTMRHVFRRLLEQILGVHRISSNDFVGGDADPNVLMMALAAKGSDHHVLGQQSGTAAFRNGNVYQRHNGAAQIEDSD